MSGRFASIKAAGQTAKMERFKQVVRTLLVGLGLLHASRLLRVYIRQGARGLRHYRIVETGPRRAAAFIGRYADTFGSSRPSLDPTPRDSVVGAAVFGWLEVELCLAKAFEAAGWRPMRLQLNREISLEKRLPPMTAY